MPMPKEYWLVPNLLSTIESRNDIRTFSKLGEEYYNLPIITAPMVDVTNSEVSNKVNKLGGLGMIHRFNTIEEQLAEFQKAPHSFCAIGVNGDWYERYQVLNKNGCSNFCIDVANGASTLVVKTIDTILKHNPLNKFIIGNIAHSNMYFTCSQFPGVIGIRLGIAGGHACTTKNATGILSDLYELIIQCRKVKLAKGFNTAIIADGGISGPGDFCKAMALGADFCMLGSEIARCSDSPAQFASEYDIYNGYYTQFPENFSNVMFPKIINQNKKIYRGSASFENQKLYKENPRYIEGTSRTLEVNGTIEEMATRYSEGLKSCMSYFNARIIDELHRNVNYRVE